GGAIGNGPFDSVSRAIVVRREALCDCCRNRLLSSSEDLNWSERLADSQPEANPMEFPLGIEQGHYTAFDRYSDSLQLWFQGDAHCITGLVERLDPSADYDHTRVG